MTRKHFLVLGLILLLALFLRVYQLNKVPIELFGDEIDVGIQAYSILKTGKDYLGNSFPVMFQSFDESRLPLLIYSAVPSVALFGLNEWGVRLPASIFGVLSVVGIFLVARKLFNFKVAIISAVLLTISPWNLHYSRWSNDAISLLGLVSFGTYFFLLGLRRFSILVISAIFFSLTLYAYSISAVFLPLFLLLLLFLYWKDLEKISKTKLISLAFILIVLVLPYIYYSINGPASERFSKISIFADQKILDKATESQAQDSSISTKLFRNKFTLMFNKISENYIESFSSQFLFTRGDPNFRHAIAEMGQMYLFEALFLILGLSIFAKNIYQKKVLENKEIMLILGWILIAPVAAALTKEGGNHNARVILMLPPLVITTALGIQLLLSFRSQLKFKLIFVFISFLAVYNIFSYFYRYYNEWSWQSWRFWQLGYKEAITYIKENESSYNRIFFNSTYEPALPRFLFWYQFDPKEFQKLFTGKDRKEQLVKGFNGFSLGDKYYFGIVSKLISDQGFVELLGKEDVYMVSQRDEVGTIDWTKDPPKGLNILKVIYNPKQEPIFYIVTKKES